VTIKYLESGSHVACQLVYCWLKYFVTGEEFSVDHTHGDVLQGYEGPAAPWVVQNEHLFAEVRSWEHAEVVVVVFVVHVRSIDDAH
jgi:hypothetical protein